MPARTIPVPPRASPLLSDSDRASLPRAERLLVAVVLARRVPGGRGSRETGSRHQPQSVCAVRNLSALRASPNKFRLRLPSRRRAQQRLTEPALAHHAWRREARRQPGGPSPCHRTGRPGLGVGPRFRHPGPPERAGRSSPTSPLWAPGPEPGCAPFPRGPRRHGGQGVAAPSFASSLGPPAPSERSAPPVPPRPSTARQRLVPHGSPPGPRLRRRPGRGGYEGWPPGRGRNRLGEGGRAGGPWCPRHARQVLPPTLPPPSEPGPAVQQTPTAGPCAARRERPRAPRCPSRGRHLPDPGPEVQRAQESGREGEARPWVYRSSPQAWAGTVYV